MTLCLDETQSKKVYMTNENKSILENILVQKTQNILSFYQQHNSKAVTLSFGDQLHDLALLLLCPALSQQNIPVHLIFMPDSHTDTLVYDTLTKLCDFYKINLKIIPIKFLQGLYKNLFTEYLQLSVLESHTEEKSQTSSATLNSIRQTIIATLIQEKNYLYLDATSKTHFLRGYPPLHLVIKKTLCPFGQVDLSNLYDWIKSAFPAQFKKDIEMLSDILSKRPESMNLDNLQFIDKTNELNKYATLNQIDYFPII